MIIVGDNYIQIYLGETKYEKTKAGYGQFVKDIQTCLLCIAIETGWGNHLGNS